MPALPVSAFFSVSFPFSFLFSSLPVGFHDGAERSKSRVFSTSCPVRMMGRTGRKAPAVADATRVSSPHPHPPHRSPTSSRFHHQALVVEDPGSSQTEGQRQHLQRGAHVKDFSTSAITSASPLNSWGQLLPLFSSLCVDKLRSDQSEPWRSEH